MQCSYCTYRIYSRIILLQKNKLLVRLCVYLYCSRDAKRKVMSSRIVMRTIGSLRVILNTKVYHGMSVEKPNEKSVRLTGMDDGGVVKVFLIVSSPKDATALHCALKSRLVELESAQEDVSKLENEENKIGEKRNDTVKCDLANSDGDGVSNSKKTKIDV